MADLGFDVVGTEAGTIFPTSQYRRAVHGTLRCTDTQGFDFALDFGKKADLDEHCSVAEGLRQEWHKIANLGPTPLQIVHGALIDAWHTYWAEFGDGTEPDILDSMRRTRDALVALEDHYGLSADEAWAVMGPDIIEVLYAGTEVGKAVAA